MKSFVYLIGLVVGAPTFAQSYGYYGYQMGSNGANYGYYNSDDYGSAWNSIKSGDYYSMANSINVQACAYNDTAGNIHVNIAPGCVIKNNLKTTKNGQQVTVKQTLPSVGGKPVVTTQTYATTIKDGHLASISIGNADSLANAKFVSTVEYTDDGVESRDITTVKEHGKTQKYVTYDRSLCRQMNKIGGDFSIEKAQLCAQFLDQYNQLMTRENEKLEKEHMKFGVANYIQGILQEINPSRMVDVAGVISRCVYGNGASSRAYPPYGGYGEGGSQPSPPLTPSSAPTTR